MRYIDEILQPGEKILFYGKVHWIIYFPRMLLLLPALGALVMSARAQSSTAAALIWLVVAFCFAAVAGVTLFWAWFRRWTTELDVTDRRVVHKWGFISRHTVEMNMDKIESVDVEQSLWGRIFDFGDIAISGTGTGWEPISTIKAPLKFRNCITAR